MQRLSQPSHDIGPAGPGLWLLFALYQLVMHLAFPVIGLFILWRSRREPLLRAHFGQRLGLGPVGPRHGVWVFAASLGETRAASPLIARLLDDGRSVCLTCSSAAGLAEARRLFGGDPRMQCRYAPLDLVFPLIIFLARLRPAALLIVELEFWPGKLMLSGLFGAPVIQVNGNLLDVAFTRRFLGLPNPLLRFAARFSMVLTKSEAHRRRYVAAGVPAARIHLPGELKFDLPRAPEQIALGERLRRHWCRGRPLLFIASSITGEEAALTAMCQTLMAGAAPPRIIWAPRSPQRFDAVARALAGAGLRVARRSTLPADPAEGIAADADILLADSIGEMNIWYQAADLVFVGASLVDMGGHNIVEPLALGRPVVMGPSIFGIAFPAAEARDAGALQPLDDADALTGAVAALFADPAALAAFTGRARAFSAAHLGASDRSHALIRPLIRGHEAATAAKDGDSR